MKSNNKLHRIDKFLQKLKMPLAERFVTYNCIFLNQQKNNLYTDEFKQIMTNFNSYEIMDGLFEESECADARDRGLYSDINMYLVSDLLVKVDIASMAVSLEGRSPMLDSEFMQLAAQIPFELKVKNGETKYILKKAAEKLIPRENIYRQKMGFSMPLREWFSGDLNKFAKEKLLNKNTWVKNFLKEEEIKRMLELHGRQEDFAPRLWAILTLELWLEEYFY
jgi:asparagine synthase (glutamine-hydrolysing)